MLKRLKITLYSWKPDLKKL